MKLDSLAARTRLMRPSPTLAITAKARELKAQGKDVVSFGAGEPDFDTPALIIESAVSALHSGQTRYTPSPGTPVLREAVAAKLRSENGLDVRAENIVVSCGAKHSLFNAMMTLVDLGDEVIVIAPYWMTYIDQIAIAGGIPVIVETQSSNGFVPTIDELKEKISPRTKAIVLNSPSNPSGAVIPNETLRWIAETAVAQDFWVISDEIYEKLVYGVRHLSIASLGSDILSRTVTINGCSKTFAMTGWRIGYSAAPLEVAKAMSNLQDSVTSNPTSFAQAGAVTALQMSNIDIEPMRREFERRRDLIVGLLSQLPNVKVSNPQGAFYVLPDITGVYGGTIQNDQQLADFLLDDALVATVPGSVFGAPGHLRLSYAASREDIEKGVERIKSSFSKLRA